MGYFTQADLENALGVSTIQAAYDDDQDNVADQAPITGCIDYSSVEVDSYFRANYDVAIPISPVPKELRFAALDFGIAYTIRRRPEIMAAMGIKSWVEYYDAAIAKMKRYGDAIQRLPVTTGTPANVGATVAHNDSAKTSEDRQRQWDDFGDY